MFRQADAQQVQDHGWQLGESATRQPSYRPEQRQVTSTMLTRIGWMTAKFHVSAKKPFLDFLNAEESIFKVTDVDMRGRVVPFLALQKRAVHMLVPPPHEHLTSQRVTQTSMAFRRCVFLLEDGVVQGTVQLRQGQRISDLMQRTRGFLVVHQATARMERDGTSHERAFDQLIINPDFIVGASDQTRK